VLFPGVIIEKGAVVEDSILFYDTRVGAGARLKKVITDKRVTIGEGCRVGGKDLLVSKRSHPGLLSSGLTLIGHNTHVPARTVIGADCLLYPHLDRQAFPTNSLPSGEILQ
jgi:glucose-1-phosphate adenylyltransferase